MPFIVSLAFLLYLNGALASTASNVSVCQNAFSTLSVATQITVVEYSFARRVLIRLPQASSLWVSSDIKRYQQVISTQLSALQLLSKIAPTQATRRKLAKQITYWERELNFLPPDGSSTSTKRVLLRRVVNLHRQLRGIFHSWPKPEASSSANDDSASALRFLLNYTDVVIAQTDSAVGLWELLTVFQVVSQNLRSALPQIHSPKTQEGLEMLILAMEGYGDTYIFEASLEDFSTLDYWQVVMELENFVTLAQKVLRELTPAPTLRSNQL